MTLNRHSRRYEGVDQERGARGNISTPEQRSKMVIGKLEKQDVKTRNGGAAKSSLCIRSKLPRDFFSRCLTTVDDMTFTRRSSMAESGSVGCGRIMVGVQEWISHGLVKLSSLLYCCISGALCVDHLAREAWMQKATLLCFSE